MLLLLFSLFHVGAELSKPFVGTIECSIATMMKRILGGLRIFRIMATF